MSAIQAKWANAKEKGIGVKVDDDDEYKPSDSENDSDDESLGSFYHKSHSGPLTPTPEEGMDPLGQEVGTQPLPPHNVQPEHEVTASSSVGKFAKLRGCGPTCGIQAHHIVDKDGKMLVPIPEQFRALVGDNASKLASKFGIEVQTQLLDLSVHRWKKVNAADKELMIQRLADNTIQTQAEHLSQPSVILLTPEELSVKVLKPRPGYVKGLGKRPSFSVNTTVAPVENSDYAKCQSLTNTIANGKVLDLAKFYKSIHYNSNMHEWISSKNQANYDNMIQTQAEYLSQTGAIPLSLEELLVKVLKLRSGYVKGLGMRPSFSMKTTVAPAESSDYVQRLEMQIAQQNEQIARFQKSEKKQISICGPSGTYHIEGDEGIGLDVTLDSKAANYENNV
ncbi:hypothetical protein TEA_012966 [Camellia sinensis var. sinensis]|uniref:Uncharacterized protein n=1 Tax=Camellia sinensis var. sinensis TaxID=542762 RepID=A0A4S4F4S5_CAMSN|nr:hypothetical protein TEA_012966 [Camellia sinensis var. sinensis]